jgi:hypothetical protein
VFSGIAQRLGFHVPQPEVPADESTGRFAESQWVVDFHTRLLKRARVQPADARPTAWTQAARIGLNEDIRRELLGWLDGQFREADHIVIGDPRLSWFLSLWRRCAEEVGAAPRVVALLRHPAVIGGERRDGTRQGEISRTAGWLNQILFTERATREGPRVFVRYEDLLDDWPRTIVRVGDLLNLRVIADASWTSMVNVEQFLDPASLYADHDEVSLPPALRKQADEVWELVCLLAGQDSSDERRVTDRLDAARSAYVELYEDAEAIARSSVWAAGQARRVVSPRAPSPSIFRVVPLRLRRKVPLEFRKAVARKLRGGA